MRLAFVSILAAAPWAACEELWAECARQALADGHEVLVSVYDVSEHAPQVVALRDAGAAIELRPTARRRRKSALLTRALGGFATLKGFAPDSVCVSQGGTYDISRSGDLNVLRGWLLRSRTPYVLLCHCQQNAPRSGRRRRAAEILSQARVLGVLSQNLRALSEQHLGIALANARVFQNPLKFWRDSVLPWPEQSTLRLASVARLESIKGLDLLIDALGMDRWRERDWQLTICGNGPERSALEHRVRNARLTDRVHFAGFVTDIADVWAKHHALVMPSRLEGIPIAINEAMLCGRPVVATDVGGIRETVMDARTGFLIGRPVVEEVSAALERLWSQREQLQAMGKEAFEFARAQRDPNPGGTLLRWLTSGRSHA